MSRLPEQNLWDRFRTNMHKHAPKLQLYRVENIVEDGFPDVVANYEGNISMIEMKSVRAAPVRGTTRLLGAKGLSVDQKNWLFNYTNNKGRAFVLVGVGSLENYLLNACGDLTMFNELPMKEIFARSTATTWAAIAKTLCQ